MCVYPEKVLDQMKIFSTNICHLLCKLWNMLLASLAINDYMYISVTPEHIDNNVKCIYLLPNIIIHKRVDINSNFADPRNHNARFGQYNRSESAGRECHEKPLKLIL